MGAYVARRLIQAAVTLFILSILFFLVTRINAQTQCYTVSGFTCMENQHLDQPIANQYILWLGALLRGDFGISTTGQPVGTIILQKLPPTVLLVAVSLLFQQLVALPLGILAALRPYSRLDQVLTFGSYVALSIPAFLLAFFLVFIFGVQLQVLPIAHYEDPSVPLLGSADWFSALWSDPGYVLGDLAHHLILPALALTVTGIAIDSRFMRAAMLQVLHQEYIRTARAKGLQRRAVIFKHAFRNALLPIITNLGLYLPALIGGVVVVETVFTWGGLGYTFSQSIGNAFIQPGSGAFAIGGGDVPTLQALVILSALAVVLSNLLADLAYGWLDPRIRYGGGGSD